MKALKAQSKSFELTRGTVIFEYALILALIAAICAGAVYTLGDTTNDGLGTIATSTTSP